MIPGERRQRTTDKGQCGHTVASVAVAADTPPSGRSAEESRRGDRGTVADGKEQRLRLLHGGGGADVGDAIWTQAVPRSSVSVALRIVDVSAVLVHVIRRYH